MRHIERMTRARTARARSILAHLVAAFVSFFVAAPGTPPGPVFFAVDDGSSVAVQRASLGAPVARPGEVPRRLSTDAGHVFVAATAFNVDSPGWAPVAAGGPALARPTLAPRTAANARAPPPLHS